MNRLWNNIIRPILEDIKANYIVEWVQKRINTKTILEYFLNHDAHMTAIDPSPQFTLKNLDTIIMKNSNFLTDLV